MGLSAEQKDSLETLYQIWGLDQVRKELAAGERERFANREVTEFAESWVTAQEKALRVKKWVVAGTAFTSTILIGVAIGIFLKI